MQMPRGMRANDCLQTPPWVYQPLGSFDLDPCAGVSTNIAKTNYRLQNQQDGLTLAWHGFVWCNPPFSEKEKWITLSAAHNDGILLLPERGSAPWFGPLALHTGYYFVLGKKINFIGGPSSNNLGSVLFPFGTRALEGIRNSGLPGHLVRVESFTPRTVDPLHDIW